MAKREICRMESVFERLLFLYLSAGAAADLGGSAFGRKENVRVSLTDVASAQQSALGRWRGAECQYFDLHRTPVGRVFGSTAPRGKLPTAYCARNDTRPNRTVFVTVCRERYQNFWKWLAPTVFPDAAVQIVMSDDASWGAERPEKEPGTGSPFVPEVAFCSCSQDRCHSAAMRARHRRLVRAHANHSLAGGRVLGPRLSSAPYGTLGVWDRWRKGFVWPSDAHPPTYSPGTWPLLVKYSLEPWGGGDCGDWDLNLDVRWHGSSNPQLQEQDPRGHSFTGCPTMLAPFVLFHFAHRADKAVADLLVAPDFDAAAELARKKHFAAFVAGNCGKDMNSGLRMAFFELLAEHMATFQASHPGLHARSWCYREKNPGGAEGRIRPIGESWPNHYHVGPMRRGDVQVPGRDILFDANASVEASAGRGRGRASADDLVTVGSFYDGNARAARDYKFVFAFENSAMASYVTEKIVNPKLAHSIPIYWGAPAKFLREHMNMKAFVHCDIPPSAYAGVDQPNTPGARELHLEPGKRAVIDAWVRQLKEAIRPSVQPCLRQIQQLDADDGAYKRMISESLLPGNKIEAGGFWDISTYGARVRAMLREGRVFER